MIRHCTHWHCMSPIRSEVGESTVFVKSMSDLFHKDVPVEFIQNVFRIMPDNPQACFSSTNDVHLTSVRYADSEGWLQWPRNVWMEESR